MASAEGAIGVRVDDSATSVWEVLHPRKGSNAIHHTDS